MRRIIIVLSMVVLLSGCASTGGEIDQPKTTTDPSTNQEKTKSISEVHQSSQGSRLKAACVHIKRKLEARGCNNAVMDGEGFYGIAVRNVDNMHIEDFEITEYTNDGISYNYSSAYHRPSISAWGTIQRRGIYGKDLSISIEVENGSKKPLASNYYSDSFFLVTESGTRYKLSKLTEIRYYPNNINPGESASYEVAMPDVNKEDIRYIVAGVGISNQAVIVLVPTPPKMCKGVNQRSWVKNVQKVLVESGEDVSTDGIWGPKTASALKNTCPKQYSPAGCDAISVSGTKIDNIYVHYSSSEKRPFIVGTANNTSNDDLGAVALTFGFYDSKGNKIGESTDSTPNLKAGESWEFRIEATNMGDFEEYKLVDKTCF